MVIARELDALESQVVRVLRPFGVSRAVGHDTESRYLLLDSGTWSVVVCVASPADTSPLRCRADVMLSADRDYADEEIWSAVRQAFWRAVAVEGGS